MGRRRRRDEKLDPSRASIAIVGCGLAGLSTALSLQQAGFQNIVIYERDESFQARKEGYGMTLTYNPKGVLAQLGVLEEVAVSDCPSRFHYLLQAPEGKLLGYFGNAFSEGRGVGQRGNLRVPRQQLRRILLDKLCSQKTCVKWNHSLMDVRYREKEADISTAPNRPVELYFANGTMAHADVLVAADGWRSNTVNRILKNAPQPRSLGVRIIVGLASGVDHPLVREGGFYTLAPGQRLFVMPFRGTALDKDVSQRQTMWQLSFVQKPTIGLKNENGVDANDEYSYFRTPEEYWEQAFEFMEKWHAPVPDLIKSTPVSTVWGTLLHDCDPWALWKALQNAASSTELASRVVVVGDALHAMSPFKGQGANQSLADGVVVAQWLQRARLGAAVQGAMREIVQRTAPVVQASREAALYWHSPDAWQKMEEHSFAGLTPSICVSDLQETLLRENITAETTNDLDSAIQKHVLEVHPHLQSAGDYSTVDTSFALELIADALQAADRCDLESLRLLTWNEHPRLVQSAVDSCTGNTCLHNVLSLREKEEVLDTQGMEKYFASRQRIVSWLVTEAGCDLESTNKQGQKPQDIVLKAMPEGYGKQGQYCDDDIFPEWWHALQTWQRQEM